MSCMVRAGWSFLKFSASKFSQPDSTSGPSATSQPIPTNTSAMRSASWVSGWRAPRGWRSHGSVTSTASSTSTRSSRSSTSAAWRASNASWASWRAAFTRLPASARSGPGSDAELAAGEQQRGPVAEVGGLGGGQRGEVGRARERLPGRGDGGGQRVGVQKAHDVHFTHRGLIVKRGLPRSRTGIPPRPWPG